MPEPQSAVDQILARLEASPPEERRAAFFRELEALPPNSRLREELRLFSRRRYAPGPFTPTEFETLAGLSYPARAPSPEEVQRESDHRIAMAILDQRRRELQLARLATAAAAETADRSLFKGDPRHTRDDGPPNRSAIAAHARAQAAEAEARDAYEAADLAERQLRSTSPQRRQASGHNWLAALRAKVGAK